MSGQTQSKRHVIACLEERLKNARVVSGVSEGGRKVIAYYDGQKAKPEAQKETDIVSLAGCDWKVEWRDTSPEVPNRLVDCGMICQHHTKHDTDLLIPFWRGSGDDMVIQQAIYACCPNRRVERVEPDGFGRVTFNSFRCAIFSYKQEGIKMPDHSFVLSPVIPHEGDELGKRIEQTILLIRFLLEAGLEKVRICVLKGSRGNWQAQSLSADTISRQSQILRSNIENLKEFEGKIIFVPADNSDEDKDIDFEIESAISKVDLVVAFNGSTGNILGRAFTYLSKITELYAIPWFILDRKWPVGEGAFVGYDWKSDPKAPFKRAIMWKVLEP